VLFSVSLVQPSCGGSVGLNRKEEFCETKIDTILSDTIFK
jgi:hypothetical protein